MRTVKEIRSLIASQFPKMTKAQVDSVSTEETAVYVLSRLLDNLAEFDLSALGDLHRRLRRVEERLDGNAEASPEPAQHPQQQAEAPEPAPAPQRRGNPRVNIHAPVAPDDPSLAADWVMGGVDQSAPSSQGPDPFAGDAIPPRANDPLANARPAPVSTNGNSVPQSAPSSGQPPLPSAILAQMAEQARAQDAANQPQMGASASGAEASAAKPAAPSRKNGGK